MSKTSMEEKIKFLMKLAKLQGFAGISQIKEIAENADEEEMLTQKLEENSIEINYFLKVSRNYKTVPYQTKKENKFMLTTRIDESGESFLLGAKYEKKLFEKMSYARDNMLKYAIKSNEIRKFIYELAAKIDVGVIKISTITNFSKEEQKEEEQKKQFFETIKQIKKIDNEIPFNLFVSLNFNEKTKSIIYNKFTQTQEYKFDIANDLYNYEQIYSNSKHEIIEANIRLVFSIAKEYGAIHKGILDISDIIQEGNIGLIGAVESFDVTKGNKFSSWAVWYIRRQIWSAVNSFKSTVYVPAKTSTDIYKISAFEEKYRLLNGKNPTTEEIAKEFNIKEKQIISFKYSDFDNPNPNYETVNNNNYNEIYNPFDVLAAAGLKENINAILDSVSKREREMIELYFGLFDNDAPMSLAQIASLYGLSSERVRQIIEKSISSIRNSQGGKLFDDYKSIE